MTAAGVFSLGVYAVLTVPFALWPPSNVLLGVISFSLYALLAAGLAVEITELVFAFLWRERSPSARSGIPDRRRVAVVMTICDDWDAHCLARLTCLAEDGYDVFVLDDSAPPSNPPIAVHPRILRVIRPGRTGAKAGNLNHWVGLFGSSYDFLVLLDADSVMSVACVDTLVLTAEHPDNDAIAIFQSKVEPRPGVKSFFTQAVSAGARPRARILARVHSPLRVLLSSGHNQLLRLACLRTVGGFPESFSAEDTALSLALATRGWRTELLDVWSYDTDPASVAAYNRRTIRWARQTVELFNCPWYGVPLRLKLLLCRHLLAYLLGPVGTLLLALSLWCGPESVSDMVAFVRASLQLQPGYALYGWAMWNALVVSLSAWALRIVLARREGVEWRTLLLTTALGQGHQLTLLVPLVATMLASAFGRRVAFEPTNSRVATARDARWRGRLQRALEATVLLSLLLAGAVTHPGSLLVGFNGFWIGALLASPLFWLGAVLLGGVARRS